MSIWVFFKLLGSLALLMFGMKNMSESLQKNLLKLYLNDVGLLTGQLYHNNIRPVLDDMRSINLGSVYESVVAQELRAHGHKLFYYDNRKLGYHFP